MTLSGEWILLKGSVSSRGLRKQLLAVPCRRQMCREVGQQHKHLAVAREQESTDGWVNKDQVNFLWSPV